MPSKYTAAQKEDALEMIRIGDNIGFVHFETGIPERTLRRWRKRLEDDANGQKAEKIFPPAAIWPSEPTSPSEDDRQDNSTASDYADFSYIRDQLMQYARHMAADLRPDDADSNRRTLALSRILDRIRLLDQILPVKAKALERPPWQDAYDDYVSLNPNTKELVEAEKEANALDERLRAGVYARFAENLRGWKNYLAAESAKTPCLPDE